MAAHGAVIGGKAQKEWFFWLLVLVCSGLRLHGQSRTPVLLWKDPAPIPYSTPLSAVQLNARAYPGPAVPVPLNSSYNIAGITSAGRSFNNGGFDGSSWAFAAELLGSSITWQQISFPLGPADAPDAVSSTTIPLPAGTFGSLLMLGDLVNNQMPPTARFVVHYADGSSATVTQQMSDWVNPESYPGESVVECVPYRHNLDGTNDTNSTCVYGYTIALDPTRTAVSLTLPNDRDVVILSLVLLPPALPGSFGYTPASGAVLASGSHTLQTQFTPANAALWTGASASVPLVVQPPTPPVQTVLSWPVPGLVSPGTALSSAQLNAAASAPLNPVQVPLEPYYRVNALYADGIVYSEKGFDGSRTAYSSTQLGSALRFAGGVFPLGPVAVPDAVTSATIALTPGQFSTLYLLGAGANGTQQAQPFVVNYTDGTSTTLSVDLSSWTAPQAFADETLVASTTAGNLGSGAQVAGSFNVYGYTLPLDSTRVVQSLQMPSNTNVILLAVGLGTGGSYPVAGSFVYSPQAGTVVASSITLSTVFNPVDGTDFSGATASVPLRVAVRDFSLAGSTTVILHYGQTATVPLLLTPLADQYNGPVTFSVQGQLPLLSSVSFSPATVSAKSGPTDVTMMVHTQQLSASAASRAPMLVALALLIPLIRRRRMRRILAMVAAGTALVMLPAGCGSGYGKHAYPLTVVATDGVFQHSVEVTVQVGP